MKIVTGSFKTDWILPRILICTVIFYFLKTAFWPLTFLFVAAYGITVLFLIIKFERDLKFNQFIIDFRLPLLLATVYVLEFLLRAQFSIKIVQKDILLIMVLFSLFYILY